MVTVLLKVVDLHRFGSVMNGFGVDPPRLGGSALSSAGRPRFNAPGRRAARPGTTPEVGAPGRIPASRRRGGLASAGRAGSVEPPGADQAGLVREDHQLGAVAGIELDDRPADVGLGGG